MAGDFSSCKMLIMLQVLICMIVMVIAAKAKIKGTFKCTTPPRRHTGIERGQGESITCSTTNLPYITNGSFDCAPNTNLSMGESCTLSCNDGFYTVYLNQVVCEAGPTNQEGKWPEGSFECRAIKCPKIHLPTVNAGYFNCSGYSVGDKCNLTCDDGFYPGASKETVCEEKDGHKANWTFDNFQCTAITCQNIHLPSVNDGYFNCSGYSVGDKCNLTCEDGFYPHPSNKTVCEVYDDHTANWSVGEFQCSECSGWSKFSGNEYKFISTLQNWTESQLLCESNNSHLVTIGDREENEFVHKMVWHCQETSRPAWVGLNDRKAEGTWEWSDGTVSTYRNWREGQPDGANVSDCVSMHINDGEWYSSLCSYEGHAVCERTIILHT